MFFYMLNTVVLLQNLHNYKTFFIHPKTPLAVFTIALGPIDPTLRLLN